MKGFENIDWGRLGVKNQVLEVNNFNRLILKTHGFGLWIHRDSYWFQAVGQYWRLWKKINLRKHDNERTPNYI